MVIKAIIRGLIKSLDGVRKWADSEEMKEQSVYEEVKEEKSGIRNVFSVWDFVVFARGSQSDHLNQVIGFDDWVSMDEIRQRIKELLGVEYKNERSLYPYIKTLVDCGFLEASDVGGKRKWRKKEFLIEVKTEKEIEAREEAIKKKIVVIAK